MEIIERVSLDTVDSDDAPRPSQHVGFYYDDFEVGMEWRTRQRLITQTDVANFASLSWDLNPLHFDEEYCRQHSSSGLPIAHVGFGVAVISGLLQSLEVTAKTLLTFVGFRLTVRQSIRVGDIVHAVARVEKKHPSTKDDRGLLVFGIHLLNDAEDIVQKGTAKILFRRQPSSLKAFGPATGAGRTPVASAIGK